MLLVDDQPANLLALEAVLQNLNLQMVQARSGEEALQHLEGREFAAVLLDVQMRGLNGFETARLIRNREQSRHTPIIFLTAFDTDRTTVEQAYALGAVDFLVKPLMPVVLRAKVNTFVELFEKTKQVELHADQLRRAEQKQWHTMLSSIGDAVLVTDAQGRLTFLNSVAESLTGWQSQEAMGHRLEEVFHVIGEANRQPIANPVDQVMQQGGVVALDSHCILIARDGKERMIDESAAPVRDDQGNIVGIVLVFRDVSEKRCAERTLRESEEFHRAIADLTSDFAYFARFTPDGDVVIESVSEGFVRFFGYTLAEMNAMGGWSSVIHPDDRSIIAQTIQRSRDGHEDNGEVRTITQGGAVKWLSYRTRPYVEPATGRITGLLGAAEDVTDRMIAAIQLRRRVAEVEALMEVMPIAVWKADDPECKRITGNRASYELLRLPPGTNISLTAPPEEHIATYKNYRNGKELSLAELPMQYAAAHGVELRDVELDLVFTDGSSKRIYGYASPLFDEEGAVRGCVSAFLDITEKQKTEEALRASESQFRLLADSIPQLAWMARPDGHIFWFNKRWYEYTRTTPEQMEGWGWQRVHDPKQLPQVLERWKSSLATGEPFEMVFPLRGAEGAFRWFLTRVMPLRGPDGRILRWFGTNTDITERRQMEAALKEADRRKNDFLAMLAHELRNPLAPIRNALYILRMRNTDGVTAERAQEMMERQLQHLVRLVDDLLDVSRIMRNKIELRKERVDLRQVVERAVETAHPVIDAQGHKLSVDLPSEPILVDADAVRLAQVIANLLNNAAKYTEKAGRIWLTVRRMNGTAEIRVQDTGIGIAPDLLPKVFDLFVQADRSIARSQGGLGIGLTLVKYLVEMHGGTVTATSQGLGHGSEFVVRLPVLVAPDRETEIRAEGRENHHAARYRMLVVDDNVDAAESLGMLLRLLQHEVRVVHGGLAALEAVHNFRPDVILLDIGMPDLDGYEVARRLRQMPDFRRTLLVAVSGYGQEEDQRRSKEVGFDFHLVKPVDPQALQKLIVH